MKHEHERVKFTDNQQEAFDNWAGPKDPDVSDAKYWIEKNTELDFNAFSFKCLNLLIKQAVWRYHHRAFKVSLQRPEVQSRSLIRFN